jgi:LmbE family N-acetylglucosaminyl deacetylase
MRILYIFPHPDDESFGPAPAMKKQLNQGHHVHLLTLTRGGATKIRHELGLSIEEMGEVRFDEMKCVEKQLGLTSMIVLDLPDSGLKNINPIELEAIIKVHILMLKPQIIVTYAVHGISGFHDHLVTHAVVKRVYCELKDQNTSWLKRLALFTLSPDYPKAGPFNLQSSTWDEIQCIITVTNDESLIGKKALECYKTYHNVIEKTGVMHTTHLDVHFEFFGEQLENPVKNITDGID